MWDAIDCHKARQMGWKALSWDEPDLRFKHLRPMGPSQTSIYTGRKRHGFGRYFMGTDPLFFFATAVFRSIEPPYVLGSLASLLGYWSALLAGQKRHEDAELRNFIRAYQRRTLMVGRSKAMAEVHSKSAKLGPSD